MIYPEDLQNAQQTLQHAMMSGEVTTFQCRIKRLDGATRHLLLNGQVIYDTQKNLSNLLAHHKILQSISHSSNIQMKSLIF